MRHAAILNAQAIYSYFPDLSILQKQQFEQLGPLYMHWNAQINVISRKDIDQLYINHVLHSLAIAKKIHFLPKEKVLDVGTGGGFPGIPLAILFPETTFYLVDSIAKKIKIVSEVVEALGLKNVKPICLRAEQISDRFNFVVSRAVAKLGDFYPWVKDRFAAKSYNTLGNGVLYLKGGDLTEEISESGLKHVVEVPIRTFFQEAYFDTKSILYFPAQ